MKLSALQFEERYRANQLVLTFIGMSNVGKSYWSRALGKKNFFRICSDELLQKILRQQGSIKEVTDEGLAAWLGMPYMDGFLTRQTALLALEKTVFEKVLTDVRDKLRGNTVIDAGGSSIYAGEKLCREYRTYTMVVYLEATDAMRKEMFERFQNFPKALIWGNMYKRDADENQQGALARCYPKLLEYRAKMYEQYSDLKIPYQELPRDGRGKQFLECLKARL